MSVKFAILINLLYYIVINRHIQSQFHSMCQNCDKGLDSLYGGKWRKISKSHCDLDLDPTMPILGGYFHILFKFQVDSLIIFWVIMYTDRHTDTHTNTHRRILVLYI